MTQQIAEVVGVITSLTFPKNKSEHIPFKIFCPKINKTFNCHCSYNVPMRINDTIYAICTYDGDKGLEVVRPPFIQPTVDSNDLIGTICRICKVPFVKAKTFYDDICLLAGGKENFLAFMSAISQSYYKERTSDFLYLFPAIDVDAIRKYLSWWYKERIMRSLYLLNLSRTEIIESKIPYNELYGRLLDNPYKIYSISIEKADTILQRVNKPIDKNERYKGQVMRFIWKYQQDNNWSCVPTNILVRNFPTIKNFVPELKEQYGLVIENRLCYLADTYRIEQAIFNFFKNFIAMKSSLPAQFTRDMSEDQRIAVDGALNNGLSIITGSAGTGKSTCIGQLVHNLDLYDIKYVMCAFTGKAVSRIKEITGKSTPSTIHRLIMNKKKSKDLTYDHIIIDEASMVTMELFYELITAFPNTKKLTFVGDVNQLSPIGWGSLFKELLKSETVAIYKLTTNYRVYNLTGERDGIILNANALITHDSNYPFEYVMTNNFTIFEGGKDRVMDIVRGCFSSSIKLDNLIVICPYNKYLQQLNEEIQLVYDISGKQVIDSRGKKWIIGDKVMLIENDYEIGVYNGEMGRIYDLNELKIFVDFGGAGKHDFLLEPKRTDIRDEMGEIIDDERTVKKLVHSYAITVDKSQGSEWDFVIFYLPEFNLGSFINKNRIYTALTRSKRACWVVTPDIEALNIISVKNSPYRCEFLHKNLKENLPHIKPFSLKIKELEQLLMENGICEDGPDFGFDEDDM